MTGAVKAAIIARRGKEARSIAKVAAARRLLTLVYYGLRDGADPLPGPGPPTHRPRHRQRWRHEQLLPGQRPGARSPGSLPRHRHPAARAPS